MRKRNKTSKHFHQIYIFRALSLAILIFPVLQFSFAEDYIWSAKSNGMWNSKTNWLPNTDYPKTAEDKAVFNSTSSFNCTVTQSAAVKEILVDSGFKGTLTILAFIITPEISADFIDIKEGNIINNTEKFISNKLLYIEGGNSLDLTSDGDTSKTGGLVGALNFRGADSHLSGTGSTPQEIGALNIKSGVCSLKDTFIAGMLSVNADAKLLITQLSALTTTINTVNGTIALEPLSSMIFASGANIAGTIDASMIGSMIICNGNWQMPGVYKASGYPVSVLTINQGIIGSSIDHGTNNADAVIIQNDIGKKSTWSSTNTIQQFTVSTSTTLEIASAAVLSVEGSIINQGKIIETPPGHIHHNAGILQAVNDFYIPLKIIRANDIFNVFLMDSDENLNSEKKDTAEGITITNTRNNDTLKLSASENGNSTGAFLSDAVKTVKASGAVADERLQVLSGDTLVIEYIDNEDAEDSEKAAVVRIFFEAPVNIPRGIMVF